MNTFRYPFYFILIILVCAIPATTLGAQETEEPPPDPNVTVAPELFETLEFRLVGPYRGGRSTAGTGVPGHPFTFYMGTTGGGVWKTDDAGESWHNISDKFFKAGSIGAIAVAPSDINVIYVGTGSNAPRGNVSPGIGVYRSTDAGKSWKHVGLNEAGQIGRIRIQPANPDIAYAAALGHIFGPNEERGVFRTLDGGTSWEKILFVSEKTGAVDLAIDVNNPRVLYAGMWTAERKPWTLTSGSEEGGLYKTVDGGDNWEKLEGGLPDGEVGKIGVAVSPVNSDRVWALIEAEDGGVYRSDDAGKSWKQINKNRKLRQRAWYYSRIYGDPVDENTVYALNTSFYKSVDAGKTFTPIRVLHGDCHDLWINPQNPEILLQTNDGGAHVSLNGGKSWSTLNNQPTAEIYRLAVDNQFPYRIYGSQQDNSTISVPSRNPQGGLTPYEHWRNVGGCESGHLAVDPRDPNIIYAGCYGGAITRTNLKTWQSQNVLVYPQLQLGQAPKTLKYRFQWNAPIRLSPHNPDVLYHTSQIVHRSGDRGNSWEDISPDLTRNDKERQVHAGGPITLDNTGVEVYGTIFAFEESSHEAGLLWAGSDDGLIHISRDGGKNWKNVTPEAMPESGTVNMIDLSPFEPGRALVVVQRYRFDDFKPYIFRTEDYGETWSLMTDGLNGIPENHFTRVVREDPQHKGLLYAGTEFGLYVSFDDGAHWQKLQQNLPVTPITDLAVHQGNLVVATQGRSFWILDDLNVLHELSQLSDSGKHLFQPVATYRAGFSQAPSRPGSRSGSSPPNGTVIHYYLAEEPSDEEVVVEILDEQGTVIRTYKSKAEEEKTESDSPFQQPEKTVAPAKAGLNKLVWNLRYPKIDKPKGIVVWGYTGGPKVVPGNYSVRLTVGEWTDTKTFRLLKDPRNDTTQEELEEQFAFMQEIKAAIDELYETVETIRSVKQQLSELGKRAEKAGYGKELQEDADALSEKLTAIEEELVQPKNESDQDPLNFPPVLDNHFIYVYGYVGGADARPTQGARERFADLKKELESLLGKYDAVIKDDVAAFEKQVKAKGIPRILAPEAKE